MARKKAPKVLVLTPLSLPQGLDGREARAAELGRGALLLPDGSVIECKQAGKAPTLTVLTVGRVDPVSDGYRCSKGYPYEGEVFPRASVLLAALPEAQLAALREYVKGFDEVRGGLFLPAGWMEG